MRFATAAVGVLSLAASALGKEKAKDQERAARLYENGVIHEEMMGRKMNLFKTLLETGNLDTTVYPRLNYTKCVNGVAEAIKGDKLHTFKCKNMDLYDFINHATLGSPNSDPAYDQTGSSAWGWTDPISKREFIASGMYDGTAFIEILSTGKMVHLAFLPPPADISENSLWKEIRGYKHYVLIGSELRNHGIQIVDMAKLLTIKLADAPVAWTNEKDVESIFKGLPQGRTHNVVVNEELEYGVAVGAAPRSSACKAGLIFFDLKDPKNPTPLGCNGDDGYVHDAQCLVYHGPDKRYEGRDICYGYNEDTLTIYDVTNKNASKIISITSYEGATYTHQGWVLDVNNQHYLLMDDEIDEEEFAGPAADQYPVTYIWDISDLEHPKNTGLYKATVKGIDHNQYVIDGLSYQSNYAAGVRVYDVSSIPEDPTGNSVCEIAYFDIYPEDDDLPGGGLVDYYGTWASYAYFKSGFIFVNTLDRGAFVVKMTSKPKCKPKTCNADNCLRALRANTIPGRLEESQKFCGEFTKTFTAVVDKVVPYAQAACTGNVISRVSSACSCLPTPTPA